MRSITLLTVTDTDSESILTVNKCNFLLEYKPRSDSEVDIDIIFYLFSPDRSYPTHLQRIVVNADGPWD